MSMSLTSQGLESISSEEIEFLMTCPDNIRHVSIIGGAGYQKSSLSRLLAQQSTTEEQRPDSDPHQENGRTPIHPILASLCTTLDESLFQDILPKPKGNKFLVNLVDPPNCPDYPGATALSLCMTDGALVVLDSISLVSIQTEKLLTTAFNERNKVAFVIDNLDDHIRQSQEPKEGLYQRLLRTVTSINKIIDNSSLKGEQEPINCIKGNVAFSAVRDGWAFTVPQFAAVYAKKFALDRDKIAKRFWGDNYFNPVTKKWSKSAHHGDRTLERSFNQFILDPICKIYDAVLNRKPHLKDILSRLNVELTLEEEALEGEALLQTVMRKFLPAPSAILQMICIHLPSPVVAQPYRTEILFDGQMNENLQTAIRTCDPNGSLVVYVSRLVATTDQRDSYAFGRVYSGHIAPGMDVKRQTSTYSGSRNKRIENTLIFTNGVALPVQPVPAGNLIGIQGLPREEGQYLITSTSLTDKLLLRLIHPSSMATIWARITPENPKDLPTLLHALQHLSAYNPYVRLTTTDSGEHAIYAHDEPQLQDCLQFLKRHLPDTTALNLSTPLPSYRESIHASSPEPSLAKSPNRRIRFYTKATPLPASLTADIERLSPRVTNSHITWHQFGSVVDTLALKYEWTRPQARKIWSFGHETSASNMLVDETKAVQFLTEIRDNCTTGFRWATSEGPLCEEPMRGVRLGLLDVTMNCDAIQRGGGQVIPTMRRTTYASVLRAGPFLAEPVMGVEVRVSRRGVDEVRRIVQERGGSVVREESGGVLLRVLFVHLPAEGSLGFADAIKAVSGGLASCNVSFDHWGEVKGGFEATAAELRRIKGLSPDLPKWESYIDRL